MKRRWLRDVRTKRLVAELERRGWLSYNDNSEFTDRERQAIQAISTDCIMEEMRRRGWNYYHAACYGEHQKHLEKLALEAKEQAMADEVARLERMAILRAKIEENAVAGNP